MVITSNISESKPHSTTTTKVKPSSIYPVDTVYPTPSLPLDVQWLMRTCAIQSKSRNEGPMIAYVTQELEAMGLEPHFDAKNNIYVTKGEADVYPCMVAHMDTVHYDTDGFTIGLSVDGNVLYAYAQGTQHTNLSHLSPAVKQCGVGGDDRTGVHACLQLLKELPYMKAAFWVCEEIGGADGSGQAYMPFFEDCSMVLQCDRRGSTDWVQTASGTKLASDEFINTIRPFLSERHYTTTQNGGFTDVANLKTSGLGVCAANMSCGYYNPHSATETIYLPAFENTLSLCYDIFRSIGHEKQLHAYAPYKSVTYVSKSANKAYKKSFSPYDCPTWSCEKPAANSKTGAFLWKKTVGGLDVITNLMFYQVEAAEAAYQLEQQATKDTEANTIYKQAKKAAKEFVDKHPSWSFEKGRKKWVKGLEGADGQLWIVAYATSILDVAAEEKEFEQMYGDDIKAGTFDAYDCSCWLHEYLEMQKKELEEEVLEGKQRQEEIDILRSEFEADNYEVIDMRTAHYTDIDDDEPYLGGSRGHVATCAECQTERMSYSDKNSPTMYCENCKEFTDKITSETVRGSERDYTGYTGLD